MSTTRQGFNFYVSYYDVYEMLKSDKDKLAFIDALLQKQFLGKNPTDLKGMVEFAYESQKHSINRQVKGFEDKTKTKLPLTPTHSKGSNQPLSNPPSQQVEEEVEVEEKVYNTKSLEVLEVYKSYPTSYIDDKGNIKPLAKSNRDKEKIASIFNKEGIDGGRKLFSIMKRYISECTASNTYLKQLSTFLNNIPDYSEDVIVKLKKEEKQIPTVLRKTPRNPYMKEDGTLH